MKDTIAQTPSPPQPDFRELFESASGLPHEQTLDDSRALQALFQHAFDGIFITGPDGFDKAINDAGCALVGEARETLLGKCSLDLIAPEHQERVRDLKNALLRGSVEAHVSEWLLCRKDGSSLSVEWKIHVLSNGGWVSFVRDISAHKRALAARESLAEQLEYHVRLRTDQLRRLGADLEFVEERERRKIAQDLHDDLGQTLAAARIWLASLCASPQQAVSKAACEVDALIERANRSTRSLAAQLAPAILYELGLCPALEWLGQDVGQTFGLKVSVIDDGQPKPLDQNVASILYRATRELLINAAKHARADSAMVQTSRVNDRIIVRVSDAGVGFDPTQVSASPQRGMGLVSVRERLSFIGGTAEVHSIPGDGTEAVLSALLASAPSEAADFATDPVSARGKLPDGAGTQGPSGDDALQSIIDALQGNVVVLDAQGRIRCVNRAWREFADTNGDLGCRSSGPGANYLDVCRQCAAKDPHAAEALAGILAVLNGLSKEFTYVYPCHSPDVQRWFMMHVAPLVDGSCLITHVELSNWVDPQRMAAMNMARSEILP